MLLTSQVYEENEGVRELLQRLDDPDFLRAQCEAIESARLDSEVRRARTVGKLAETELKLRAADPNELPYVEDRVVQLREKLHIRGKLEEELCAAHAPEPPGHELEAAHAERADLAHALAQARATPGSSAWERELKQRAQQAFLDTYLSMPSHCAPGHEGRDSLSLPIPTDSQGLLCAENEPQEPGLPSVDVVICVHDALEDVRRCLHSLLAVTQRRFRLIVVDDGSAEPTRVLLADLAARHPAVTLIHRAEPPHGYTLAANAGLHASGSDYVVLLDSDTLLHPRDALERLVDYGWTIDVGRVGPLLNAASHQSVPALRDEGSWAVNPLPDWLTEEGMALIVERGAPRVHARLSFINGFCFVIKRAVVEAIGYSTRSCFASRVLRGEDYCVRACRRGIRARRDRRRLRLPREVEVVHARGTQGPGQAQLPGLSRQARARANRGDGPRSRRRYRARPDPGDRERRALQRFLARAALNRARSGPLQIRFVLPGHVRGRLRRLPLDLPGGRGTA